MKDNVALDQERQLVVFSLYREEFGVEITKVREIIKPRNITKLPHVSEYIEGVTNLRGEVIPVICLRTRFGLERQENTQDTRIIIVEVNQHRVGFIVDAVNEVLRMPSSAIEPPPRSISGLSSDYLQGVGKIEGRLLLLLEVDKVLTSEEHMDFEPQEVEEA